MAAPAVPAANSNVSNIPASVTKSAAQKDAGEPNVVSESVAQKDSAYGGVKCPTEEGKVAGKPASAQPSKTKTIAHLEKKLKSARSGGIIGVIVAFLLSMIFLTFGIIARSGKLLFFDPPNVMEIHKTVIL